jgi:DNA (cytosine-5)-methyltransferase 1
VTSADGPGRSHTVPVPMEQRARTYGVKLVRGPIVSIPCHPDAADDVDELLRWCAERPVKRPLAADLFCGAGGLSVGLTDAGYDVVVGVDHDERALETHAGLHPGLTLRRDLGDPAVIAEIEEILVELGVDLIGGGPPCQPFSRAGSSKIRSLVRAGVRTQHDDRRDLWQSFLEIALRVQPPAVLLENVPDMAIGADTTIVRTIVRELELCGYGVHTALLHASEHGVPQFRQRFILVALRDELDFRWPKPSCGQVTVGEAIGDLPAVAGGARPPGGAEGFLDYQPPSDRGPFLRRARRGLRGNATRRVFDHVTRPVREDDRLAFEVMSSTTKYSDLDQSLRRYRDDIFDDKYKRLDADQPSRSITAHIARDGYWYIHPDQPRTLTVREAARIQTFPDRIRFAGPPSSAFRQIGNAVPPALAGRVGAAILDALSRSEATSFSTIDVASRLVLWFEGKEELRLPWLEAATPWVSLNAQLLLHRSTRSSIADAWPLISKLDTPERTLERLTEVEQIAERVGRRARSAQVATTARWFASRPDALESWEAMAKAPHVGPSAAEIAALVDPSCGPTPVVVSSPTLRVASRVLGVDVERRRSRSDGRLAIANLISGPAEGHSDDSRIAMAAVVELAASSCRPVNPACGKCPLNHVCLSSPAHRS